MTRNELQGEMNAMLQLLNGSDYKLLKYIEGKLTKEEYDPIAAKRQEWRERYNKAQKALEELPPGQE